jgi:hypothetical protein
VTASIDGVIERCLCDPIPGSIREWSTLPEARQFKNVVRGSRVGRA